MEEAAVVTFDRSAPPRTGPPPPVTVPTPESFSLSNGLRVVMVPLRSVPIVNVALQVRGGGWEVPADKAGLATLTADLLDEGTATLSAIGVAEAFEGLGAGLSSMAGRDANSLRMGVIRRNFEAALDLFTQVLMEPAFAEDELERVRAEQLTRILQGQAEPRIRADETLAASLYGDRFPYGTPVPGTEGTVSGLMRDDVLAYYRDRYRPGNATLMVTGDVDRDELEPLLETGLGTWQGASLPETTYPEPSATDRTTVTLVDKPGAPQSEIRIGRLTTDRRSDDYFDLTVLNTVLGGSFTSRLNMKLREEKGYTYGARSSFALRRRVGPFVAGAAVHTGVTDSAVTEFLREIRRIVDEPVEVDELERAKNYVALRLPQGFETAADLSARISELVLYDLPLDYFNGYVDSVLAVDQAGVQAAARKHLDGGLAIVVVGDREAVEEPLRALGVGEVSVLDSEPPEQTQAGA
jgi:predicted Zn-dependent peptidase